MSIFAVWLDHQEAHIFNFLPGQVKKEKLKQHGASHHTGNHEAEKQNQVQKFYHEIAEHLKLAQEVLVLGPGMAKTEFTHFLEGHHHKDLAKKIVAVESMDYASENEIEKKARIYFTKHNLFT